MRNNSALALILEMQKLCKGYLKADDYLEALSLFLAVGAVSPNTLRKTGKLIDDPKTCQEYFFSELERLTLTVPNKPWETGRIAGVPGPVLAMLARVVSSSSASIPELAEATRRYYVKNYLRRSEPDLTLQKYLQALIGNLEGKSLLDSHCGLALKTELFSPALLVLNEPDPTLSRISHRLLIAQGIDVIFCKQDYLLAACLAEGKSTNRDRSTLETHALQLKGLFDIVIAEPPTRPLLQQDQLEILAAKFPFLTSLPSELPSTASTSLWIQQTLRQLNDSGTAYIIVSNGWLSRGGYDATVRTALINHAYVDSIIALEDDANSKENRSILVLKKQVKDSNEIVFLNEASAINRALENVVINEETGDLFENIEPKPTDPYCVTISAENILSNQDLNDRSANLLAQHYLPSIEQTATYSDDQRDEAAILAQAEKRAQKAQLALKTLIEKYQP